MMSKDHRVSQMSTKPHCITYHCKKGFQHAALWYQHAGHTLRKVVATG